MAPDIGIRLDGPQQILIPFDFQVGMQSALHEDACSAQVDGLPNLIEDGFLRKDVSFRMPHGAVESAEAAIFGAEIRVVDIPVNDVADDALRMQFLPDGIRFHADANQIIAFEHLDCLFPGDHTTLCATLRRGKSANSRNASRPFSSAAPSSNRM